VTYSSGGRSELGRKKLTIVVPAFNEEERITTTVREAYAAARRYLDDFELIVVDDGSTDMTYQRAVAAGRELGPEVRVAQQPANHGVGAAYLLGLHNARYPYISLIPGDNAFKQSGIERLFNAVGTAEMLITYRVNMEARTPLRRLLSRLATFLVRLIAGRRIKDAHSMYVFPVRMAREIEISPGYSYHLETLCRLLRRVNSVSEIPVDLNPKPDASSGVMKPRTMLILGWAMSRMLFLRLIGRLD